MNWKASVFVAVMALCAKVLDAFFYTTCAQIRPRHKQLLFGSVPDDLRREIRSVAQTLWGNDELPEVVAESTETISGEAPFSGTDYSQRSLVFEQQAQQGDARAQHSLGLLLWSGYSCKKDAVASARWHAAAAVQNHLDGMAVLGGCLRTGTGVEQNVGLGLRLIDYCAAAQVMNPTGINKKAALEESNGNYETAFGLYQDCLEHGQPNALLLMNLGWCFVQGEGTRKNVTHGEKLWRQTTDMAPDEGSEEAAWLLYRQCAREEEKEARRWLKFAAGLGYEESLEIM
jgi:TPR repeat protein